MPGATLFTSHGPTTRPTTNPPQNEPFLSVLTTSPSSRVRLLRDHNMRLSQRDRQHIHRELVRPHHQRDSHEAEESYFPRIPLRHLPVLRNTFWSHSHS